MEILLSIFANLVTGVVVFVWQQYRMRKKMAGYRDRIQSLKAGDSYDVVLILCCRNDIENAVQNNLSDLGIQPKQILKVYREKDFSDRPEDWQSFTQQIRAKVNEIRGAGIDRVHLFLSVPLPIGVFAGALLDNGPQVLIYHYFSGRYLKIGTLSNETLHF